MPLWVKIEDGAVTQCWDTPPPEDEPGWQEAVEVRPPLPGPRCVYGQHTFDVNTTPVRIVWPVVEFPLADRKHSLRVFFTGEFRQVVMHQAELELTPNLNEAFDPAAVAAARSVFETRLAAIDAAQSHDDLDAIV